MPNVISCEAMLDDMHISEARLHSEDRLRSKARKRKAAVMLPCILFGSQKLYRLLLS